MQVRFDFQFSVRLDLHRQTPALQGQVAAQAFGPGDFATQVALALLATAPVCRQLHSLTCDQSLQLQALQAHRQLAAGQLAALQPQLAVDLRRHQLATNSATALQLAFKGVRHCHEGAQDGEVETTQTKLAADRLVRRARVDLRLQQQLTQAATDETQFAVYPLRAQRAVQAQAVVGKVQPLLFIRLTNTQVAAAGIEPDLAVGTAVG